MPYCHCERSEAIYYLERQAPLWYKFVMKKIILIVFFILLLPSVSFSEEKKGSKEFPTPLNITIGHKSIVDPKRKVVGLSLLIFPFHNYLHADWQGAENVTGLVFGVPSAVSNDVKGIMCCVFNATDDMAGLQVAGFINFATGDVNGVQISTFINSGINCNGGQIGPLNVCEDLNGFQVGLLNKLEGYSSYSYGLQLGLYNYSNDMTGLQIGLYNKAINMKGVQIGLINEIDDGKGIRFLPVINARF